MKPIESKRVALDRKIVLRFPDFEGFVTEFASNLSMTGMFVRAREPQEAGTPVAFELRLEDGAPLVRGRGWVVWARERAEGSDRPPGMGIEFVELDRKSRRLVRWMILSQLPEDEKPYEVRSGAARGASGPSRRPAGRGWPWLGALAAVLLVAALAAVFRWSGSSGEEAASKPRPGALAERDVGSASAQDRDERAAAREPAAAGGEQNEADEVAAVEAVVRDWAQAWSDQDVDRYLSHYASSFMPADGLDRSRWADLRRRRLTLPESIRVAVTRLEIQLSPSGGARVSFLQTYRSEGYTDTVDKLLELVPENGTWRIRLETTDE